MSTYGKIATMAGSPRGARQVVRILHTLSKKHELPWHRIVNAAGIISIKDPEGALIQRMKLESEGIIFTADNKIDFAKYLWIDV